MLGLDFVYLLIGFAGFVFCAHAFYYDLMKHSTISLTAVYLMLMTALMSYTFFSRIRSKLRNRNAKLDQQ